MGRTAHTKLKTLIIAAAVVIAAAGGITGAVIANQPERKVGTAVNAQHQLTYINYRGQNGVDALTLLKKHATVETKHYSFGDQVMSINGSKGDGPKYWTFYVNDKESNVGAGTYVTKDSDKLQWKLR